MNFLKNLFSKSSPQSNSQEMRFARVYAYIAGFLPDLVIGFQKDGQWYLPGGVVEDNPVLKNFPQTSQAHFYLLANYVKQQTGLVLTGLSDAQQLTIREMPEGREATVIYIGTVSGEVKKGERLDLNNLPEFAIECGSPQNTIEKFKQPALKARPTNSESPESFEGVFVSKKPTDISPNGDKCYFLLRFYADGLVLHTGICTPNIQEGWQDIRKWFHRDSLKDMGRGQYHLENGEISFTTTAQFKRANREVVTDFAGHISRDRLDLSLLSRATGKHGKMAFIRFGDSA
jgi:hypothetical protein